MRDFSPLSLYFFIVTSQPVNAFNYKKVIFFQFLIELQILRTFEVLSALFIGINKRVVYAEFNKLVNLSVLLLIYC